MECNSTLRAAKMTANIRTIQPILLASCVIMILTGDLRIYLESDGASRRTTCVPRLHGQYRTVFFTLRRLRSIRRSPTRPVFQSIVVALALSKLDFGNATLGGIPLYQLRRLQSVMNAAVRLVFSASRYDQVMPLLHRLHWLRAIQRISFKLAVLEFRCLEGLAPTYLSDSLLHVADLPGRQRLRSASSADLAVPQTRLETVGDRGFCVAASKTWNRLPSEVTLSVTLSTFKQKRKNYLFSLSFPGVQYLPILMYSDCNAFAFVHLKF